MSADNWRTCPKCLKEWVDPVKEAAKSYGKIPLEEFEAAIREAKGVKTPEIKCSLREDYEFYLKDFILQIDYGCSCQECGFEFSFHKEINIEESEEQNGNSN